MLKRGLISVFMAKTTVQWKRQGEAERGRERAEGQQHPPAIAWHLQHAYNVVMATRAAATATGNRQQQQCVASWNTKFYSGTL